jgi:hypothetical protein
MPLYEGEIVLFWLLKFRKGSCCGTFRELLAMEVLRGGGRLVALLKTVGAGGEGGDDGRG